LRFRSLSAASCMRMSVCQRIARTHEQKKRGRGCCASIGKAGEHARRTAEQMGHLVVTVRDWPRKFKCRRMHSEQTGPRVSTTSTAHFIHPCIFLAHGGERAQLWEQPGSITALRKRSLQMRHRKCCSNACPSEVESSHHVANPFLLASQSGSGTRHCRRCCQLRTSMCESSIWREPSTGLHSDRLICATRWRMM
jgi:hypothetical protein